MTQRGLWWNTTADASGGKRALASFSKAFIAFQRKRLDNTNKSLLQQKRHNTHRFLPQLLHCTALWLRGRSGPDHLVSVHYWQVWTFCVNFSSQWGNPLKFVALEGCEVVAPRTHQVRVRTVMVFSFVWRFAGKHRSLIVWLFLEGTSFVLLLGPNLCF